VGKHTDELGSFENFKAPWETDAGEVEIDKARLKKYLFNVVTDKAKAQDARDESAEKVTQIEQELETAKTEAAKGDPDGKIAKLEKKLEKAEESTAKAQLALDRLEVGIEKGLTPKQAARLQGEDREALEKDADEILETFGVQKSTTQETDEEREEREEREEEEAEEAAATGRTSPRLVNPNDPKSGPAAEPDYEKIADGVATRRF
jgi:hypothetical protein